MSTNPQVRAARLQAKADIAQAKADSAAIDDIDVPEPEAATTGDDSGQIALQGGGAAAVVNSPQVAALQRRVNDLERKVAKMERATAATFKKLQKRLMQAFSAVQKALDAHDVTLQELDTWVERFHGEADSYRGEVGGLLAVIVPLLSAWVELVNVNDTPTSPQMAAIAHATEAFLASNSLVQNPETKQLVLAVALLAKIYAYSTPEGGLTAAFAGDSTSTSTTGLG